VPKLSSDVFVCYRKKWRSGIDDGSGVGGGNIFVAQDTHFVVRARLHI